MWTPESLSNLIRRFRERKDLRPAEPGRSSRAHAEQMEPRVMLSIAKAIDAAAPDVRALTQAQGSRPLVFVDAGAAQAATLPADAEVITLEKGVDPLATITRELASRSNVPSVAIVSHGASGALSLGGKTVARQDLLKQADTIKKWTASFTDDAAIELYGCDVASGSGGESFVEALARLTGTTVAASTDTTGPAGLGADAALEFVAGDSSEVKGILSADDFSATLAFAITPSGGTTTHVVTGSATTVDSAVSVTASGDTSTTALVTVATNYRNGEDVLAVVSGGITPVFTAGTGILSLTSAGALTAAQWQTVFRAVTFTTATTAPNLTARGITFTIGSTTSAAKSLTPDLPVDTATKARIVEALDVVEAIGTKIGTFSGANAGLNNDTEVPFTGGLKVTDLFYPNSADLDSSGNPVTDWGRSVQPHQIGAYLALSDSADTYFTGAGTITNLAGLETALEARLASIVPGTSAVRNVTVAFNKPAASDARSITITVAIANTRGDDISLDLPDLQRDLGLYLPTPPTITVGGGADIEFSITVDLQGHTYGSTLAQNKTTLAFSRLNALAGFTFSNVTTTAEFGLIRGQLVNASGVVGAKIPVSISGSNSRTLNSWTTNDITAFSGTITGTANLDLPVTASIGGVLATTAGSKIVVTDSNIFDDTAPSYTTTDFSNVLYFSTMKVEDVIGEILKVKDLYTTLANSDDTLFGVNVPFLKDKTLGELFDFGSLFDSAIGEKVDIVEPVLNTPGRDALTDYRLPLSEDSTPTPSMWSDLRAAFKFGVVVNNTWPIVTVTVAADNTRNTLDDLVTDVNAALTSASLQIQASNVNGKMSLKATNVAVQKFAVVPVAPDAGRLSPTAPAADLTTLTLNQAYYYTVTGTTTGSVTGTNYYTTGTPVAAAAVHAGILANGATGVVKVTRVGAMPVVWGGTRNGIVSSLALLPGNTYLIESAESDLRRLGIVDYGSELLVLDQFTEGRVRASMPLTADLSTNAQFVITSGADTVTVDVLDYSRTDLADTLSDVQAALATALTGAGFTGNLAARLVDADNQVLTTAPEVGEDYRLEFYLPEGSTWTTFAVEAPSDQAAYRTVALGFLVGDVSATPRPASLRTFEDFSNGGLFPSISITPVYDSVAGTVTLQFTASGSTTPTVAAGFDFNPDPVGRIRPTNEALEFTPTVNSDLSFGLEFKIGPANPIFFASGDAVPTDGVLTSDAHFDLEFVLQDKFAVTVPMSWTTANEDIQDLVADINRALMGAVPSGGGTANLTLDRMVARRQLDNDKFELITATPANGGAATAITHTDGVLSSDLTFSVEYDDNEYLVTVLAADTTDNESFSDLVLNLNAALSTVTLDADEDGEIDSGETTLSLADKVFFTTIATAAGASDSNVYLYATSPGSAAWPATITLSASRTDSAVTELGLDDGAGESVSSITSRASGTLTYLRNHTNGNALAGGSLALTVPTFAGSVTYGFNTLDFASISGGSVAAELEVSIDAGVDAGSSLISNNPIAYLDRALTGAGGVGNATAALTLEDISSGSADIDNNAAISIAIADLSDTTTVIEIPIGVPIPVPGQVNGVLSSTGTVNFLYEGAKYTVSVLPAATTTNTSMADLADDYEAALTSVTRTVAGVPALGFNASSMFTISADGDALVIAANTLTANPDYAIASFVPGLSAFGEVGLQGAFGPSTVAQALADVMPVMDALQSQMDAFANIPLPLVELTLNELIDIKGDMLRRIESFRDMSVTTPEQIATAVSAAFSIPTDFVSVAFDDNNNAYRVDLKIETGVATNKPLDLTLADFYRFTNDTPPEGLARLVDTGSRSPLSVKIKSTSILSIGIDLTDPDAPRTFLYGHDGSGDMDLENGTSIQLEIEASAEGINFTAATGAFGVFVRDGNASLGGPAVTSGGQPVYTFDEDTNQLHFARSSQAATLTVTLGGNDGKFYLDPAGAENDAFDLDNFEDVFEGTAEVNLPMFTPTELMNPFTDRTVNVRIQGTGLTDVTPGGNIMSLHIGDLQGYADHVLEATDLQNQITEIYSNAGGTPNGAQQTQIDDLTADLVDLKDGGAVEIFTPDVEDANSGIKAPTLLDILRDPAILVDPLDILFGTIETGLKALDNLNIPVIGPTLGDAADDVFGWRTGWLLDLRNSMRGKGEEVFESIKESIYNVLGPGGIDLLLKDNGIRSIDGMVKADSMDDVGLDFLDEDGNKMTGLGGYGAHAMEFKLRLGQTLLDTGTDISFDFDALSPAFTLGVDGGLSFKLGWDFTFGFGYSIDDGFYVVTDSNPVANELELRFEAGLRGDQHYFQVAEKNDSPTGYAIKDKDGNWVYGPRKGNGTRDIINILPVDETGEPLDAQDLTHVHLPHEICEDDELSAAGPGFDEEVFWVVAALDGSDWVPAYMDKLGFYRPQQGDTWEDVNGTDEFNPDQMIEYNQTAPFNGFGSLFFLNLSATDKPKIGLGTLGDAEYFYDPEEASTITSNGRNDDEFGVNRNNSMPTRVAGRIGINLKDPSDEAGGYVARPGPSLTGFLLMDGSNVLGGEPVLDEDGNTIPVLLNEDDNDTWYTIKPSEGVTDPTTLADYEFDAPINEDPSENRITWGELRQGGTGLFEFVLNAEAVVNLSMVLSVSDDANIPRVTADFNLDWRTDSMTPPANPFDTTTEQKRDLVPEVGMNNIRLDLGSFLTKLIKPIAVEVDKTLKPIDPLISAIQTKIPVLSDIAGRPIKLTTLLYTFGGPKGQAVATVIEMAILVRELSGVMAAVPDDANVYLPIGNFWLAKISSGPFGQPGMGKTIYYDNSEVSAPSITQRNQSMIAEPGQATGSITTAMGKLDDQDKDSSSQPGIGNPQDKGGFNIPILEDPITIFKLLMGEDVPLVTYSLPKLNFSFEQSIPLVRIICFEAGIRLNLQMKGQLAMGYDTKGIRMFKDSGDPADLMQGFYVSDRANADGSGADVDEFWFRASIALYGEIDLYLAKGGIEGGFALTGSVNLNDPNNDGKLRVVEAYDLVKYTGNPLDLADLSLSGEVYARYYYWVGLKIWTPWKTYKITLVSGGKTFARLELFNVSREGNDGPPTFAGVVTTVNPDGTDNPSTLLVNAGPSAAKRVSNQDPLKALDGAEHFRIWNDNGSNTVKVQYKTWDQNHTQTFNNVSRVVVYGGEGNDTIDASGLNGIPVEIDGGNGNDTILLGNAHASTLSILKGGNGNDIITAGGGNLRVEGNGGNDTITGGTGTNEIDPGDGNDTVTGGGSGSTNKLFLRRSFGKDTLTLNTAALVNLLDYVDSTLPLVGTLSGAGSTIYAGDTNVTTFSLGAVTEIRGSEGRDTFNLTNPTTRNANSGKGLILRGHESIDTYNFVGDDMSNVATDGITIDDGIRPTSTATIGDITLSDPCKKIKEIKVASGGASYATAPEVVITDNGGNGIGARAVASLDKDGKVQGIYVLDGGADYTDPVVALVDRVSYGDKMIFTSTTAGAVTLDKQGNSGTAYKLTSGGKSIKFAAWTTPGTPRSATWNVSETDNVEISLPNGTLELNEHLDIQETLTVTAKRMDLNAAITADTVKITTERGFALDHPIQAVNNGDVSIRVSGKDLGDPSAIATAAATVVDGEITAIAVTNAGSHYDFAPIVAIIDERGYAARATATINGSGQVTGITVLDGGFGYLSTPAPRVIISPPASIRLAANVSSSTVGSNPGTGDGRGQITLQADLGAIVNMGEVFFPNGSNIEFKHGDFRYKSTDALEDITTTAFPTTAGGQGATATAVLDSDGRIERIDVTAGGSGYDGDLLPTVIIQGAGTATAIVSGGAITGFKITNPGEGYPSAPTVTILPNGFGKIVGADAPATALNRTHIKSAGGSLKAISYYGIGDPAKPIKTDVARMVAQTLGLEAGVNILEKDGVRIGTIDHVNGISTVDGDVAVTTFAGTIHLGQPVQAMNANGMLLWQDAAKTIPIYVRDNAGNIIYEGGQLQTGVGQIKLTADDVDINSFVGATGGQLILQPVKFDAPIGLNGTQGRATVSVGGPTGTLSINTLYSGRGYTTTPMVTLPAPGERAYGVANVVNGAVQSALVTFGGKRYNSTYQPLVSFVGGGQYGETPGENGAPGSAATATAAYDADGVVTGITINGGGSGYITAPELRITLPGIQATAIATVVDGRISGITFTNAGANYGEAPQIKIEAPYQFSLEAEEVQYLEDGFREVVIGRDDGSHTFQAADVDFDDAVRLRAPRTGGTMQVESISVDDGPVIIVGSGHTLNMTTIAPNVTGTYVEVDDNIIIHDNVNASITATTGHVTIFGVSKGKIDGVAGSLTENLTITDVGDVTITGAIGSTNPIHNLTINSSGAGNIAMSQSVTIEGDLHIVKGGNITFGGAVSIGGNLIIDEGASVSFNGTLTVGGNMTISDATTVQFAANVTVTGNLLMGNASDPTKLQAVTFANNARLDVDGTIEIYADEDITFGNRVGNTLVPNSITLRSDTGSISFAAQVFATGNTLTIIKSDDVTFGHDVNVGTLSITAGGETRFNRAVNAGTLDVLSQELVVFSNQLNISVGNATITADEVDFAGSSSTIKTVGAAIGNAVLTIKPYTVGRNIGIGSPPALFGVMDMNDTDLAAIGTGWSQVHIGDEAAGTGAVTVGSIGTQQGGTISYLANNTAVHGGSITVVQPVDMALSTGTLRLHARTGDVTTNAVLNGTALERGSIVRIEADAGNINLNQPVYASSEVQLIASGNVTEGASSFVSTSGLRVTAGGSITMLHASNAVTTVTMVAADDPIQFREDSGYAIGTVNGQTGMSAGTGDITLTTIGGTVTQSQAIIAGGLSLQGAGTVWTLTHAANDIDTLTTNTGKVSLVDVDTLTVGTVGASSGSTTTDDLSLIAGQALTVSTPITTSGPGDVSLTSVNANVSIGAAGDISSAQTISVNAVTGISSSGDLTAANGAIGLTASAGPINTSGAVSATSGSVTYGATGLVTVNGTITTVTSGNISLTSSANAVSLGAGGDLISVGTISVAGFTGVDSDGDMTSAGATGVTSAGGSIDQSGATVTTNGAVTHSAQTSLILSGTTTAGGANGAVGLTSATSSITLDAAADISAAKTITANAVTDFNSSADLTTAAGAIGVTVSAGTLSSAGVVSATAGTAAFTATGNVSMTGPVTTVTSGNVSITSSAGTVTTSAAADLLSVGTIAVAAFAGATLTGDMTAAGAISANVANGSAYIDGKSQTTNGAITFVAQDALDLLGTITAAGASGNVVLTSNGFVITLQGSADIVASGTITATAADDVNNMADWTAAGAIVATVTNGGVSTSGTVVSSGSSVAFSGPYVNNDGPISASTSITMTASDYITNSDTLTAGTTITLSGTNSVATSAAISAGGDVTITSAAIAASTSITTTDDNVTFTGPVTLPTALTIDTGATGVGNIFFSSTIDGPGALSMTAGTGDIDVTGNIGATVRLASLTVVLANEARFGANVSTTGAQTLTATTIVTNATHDVSTANAVIDINGVLSLENDTRLSTNGGTIDLTSVVGNTHDLTLASKSGAITTTGDATDLGTVSLQDDVVSSTGTVRFQGDFDAQTLTTVGRAYNVFFTGDSTTVANLVTLRNTGTTTFGDSATDETHLADGVVASGSATNPSATRLAGTLTTSAAAVTLGVTILDTNAAIDTAPNGNGGAIDFTGTLNGTHNLRLNSGDATIDFDAAVGNTSPLAAVTIDSHAGLTADGTFTAASILQSAATGTTTFGDDVNTSAVAGINLAGLDVNFAGTTTTTSGGVVTIDGEDVQFSGTVTADGDVTITATGSSTFDAAVLGSGATGITVNAASSAFNDTVTTASGNIVVTTTGDSHFGGVVSVDGDLNVTGDDVDFDATVDTAGAIGIDITAATVDFDAAVTTTGDGFLDIVATGLVNFDSTVDIAGANGITIDAASITFLDSVTTPGAVILDHSGTLTIAAAGDFTIGGAFSQVGTGAVATAGDITTTGDAVSFNGAVALTGNISISTSGGNVDFNSTLDGTHNLLLTAGAGDITFHAAVGAITPLGAVTIASADAVTLMADFASANFTQIASTGTTSVQGLLSTTGPAGVSITAHTIEVTATGDIATAGGMVDLTADTGAITIADNATVNAGSGTITIESVGDATITGLVTTNATSSAVSITTSTGAILDGGAAATDITAAATGSVVTLLSVTGVGAQANALDTRIAVLEAQVTGIGGVYLLEQGAIELRGIAVADGMIDVNAASIVATNVETANGDLQLVATTGNIGVGSVIATSIVRVQALLGALVDTAVSPADGIMGPTVYLLGRTGIGTMGDAIEVTTDLFQALVADVNNATTDGDIHIASTALTAQSVLADEVTTGVGSIQLTHTGTDLEAGLVTTGNGAIDVAVTGGTLTATDLTAGGSGDISLTTDTAGKNVLVGSVVADGTTVTITSAGDILESGDDVGDDLVTSTLTLTAAGQIGTAATPIEIDADYLSAEADGIGGGIFLTEADNVAVTKLVASGDITLAAGGIIGLNSTAAIRSDENLGGAQSGVSRDITFQGDVLMLRNTSITTGSSDGAIHFAGTVGGAYTLTLATTLGSINFDGVIGTSVTPATGLVVSSATDVTFADDVHIGTGGLDITASSLVTFDGDSSVGGNVSLDVNNAGNTGSVTVNGNFTSGGDFIVDHDGTATFADGIVFNIAGDTRFIGAGRVEFGELTYNTGGDIEFNQGPLVLTSNTVIDTGTGGGDVTFRDAVSGDYELTIIGSGGDVLFEQAAGTNGSPLALLTITGANDITFMQSVVTSGDVTLTATGAVEFTESFTSGGSIDIATSGLVAFSDQVNAADGLVIDAGTTLTFTETVTVTSGVTDLTHGSTLAIPTGANFVLGGEFHEHGTGPVVLGEVSIATTDDITFDGDVTQAGDVSFTTGTGAGDVTFNGSIDGNKTVTVAAGSGDVTFAEVGQTTAVGSITATGGAITLAGDFKTATGASLTLNGSGDISIAASKDVSVGGAVAITTSAGFEMASGTSLTAREGDDIVLTADDVAFDGGDGSISGTGLLVLQPFSTSGSMVIGTPDGNNVGSVGGEFEVGTDELGAIGTGFEGILIGRGTQGGFDSGDAGDHEITVHDATFASDVFFRTPGDGGAIRVSGTLRGLDDVSLRLWAGEDVHVDGLIRATATGDIELYADANANGVGAVRVAQDSDAAVRAVSGEILMIGDSVWIGSEDSAGEVTSRDGTVQFRTDSTVGQIFVFNSASLVSAGIDVLVGSPDQTGNSPSFIRIEGNVLAGRHVRAHSRGPVELGNFRLRGRGVVTVLADGDLRMQNGTAVSQGGPVSLVADANGDGVGTPIESDVRVSETGDVNLGVRVNSVKVKGVLSAGDKGKAWVTVTNNGTETIEQNIRVILYASLDGELDASDAIIGRFAKVLKLKPGQSKKLSFALEVPADLEPNDYRIIGEVLPYQADRPAAAAPATADDPNVDASTLLIRVRRPDLVATAVRSSFDGGTFAIGRTGKVTITVANQGQVQSAGNGTVVLYATPDGTLGSAIEISRVSTSLAIKAGKSKAVNLKVTLPQSLAGGQWQWLTVVNPDGAVVESNLDNNSGVGNDNFQLAA